MPPKKSETPIVPDTPEQAPGFDNDQFMEDMLAKARSRDVQGVEDGVALALKTEDYKTNIRSGVLVDFHVETVLFCAQQGFAVRKSAAFIKWVEELRVIIATKGEDAIAQAKAAFKDHLVAHAERSTKDATGAGDNALGDGESAPAPIASPKLPAAPAKKGDKKANTKGQADGDNAARTLIDTNIYLAVADMGAVSDFVVTGLLQHWRLYQYVANGEMVGDCRQEFHLGIQVPMAAPPLVRAITNEQYEANAEDARKVAEAELKRRQDEEAAAMEAQRQEEARKEEERLAFEEEERQNKLFFEKDGTEKAVNLLQTDLESQLSTRQRELVARIAKLEQNLGVSIA